MHSRPFTLSVAFQTDQPLAAYGPLAAAVEGYGFDGVAVYNDLLYQPCVAASPGNGARHAACAAGPGGREPVHLSPRQHRGQHRPDRRGLAGPRIFGAGAWSVAGLSGDRAGKADHGAARGNGVCAPSPGTLTRAVPRQGIHAGRRRFAALAHPAQRHPLHARRMGRASDRSMRRTDHRDQDRRDHESRGRCEHTRGCEPGRRAGWPPQRCHRDRRRRRDRGGSTR